MQYGSTLSDNFEMGGVRSIDFTLEIDAMPNRRYAINLSTKLHPDILDSKSIVCNAYTRQKGDGTFHKKARVYVFVLVRRTARFGQFLTDSDEITFNPSQG